jgi:hypothetical protein
MVLLRMLASILTKHGVYLTERDALRNAIPKLGASAELISV